MYRRLFGLALGLALAFSSLNPAPALADGWRGHRHGDHHRHWDHDWWRGGHWYHGHHGRHFGWWWIIGPNWYFYPTPVYPYPPEIVVRPAPQVVAPAPAPASKPYCREFQGDAIINGSNQRFYGTACLMPDGSWHIVK